MTEPTCSPTEPPPAEAVAGGPGVSRLTKARRRLRRLIVYFISLVTRAANRRHFVTRSESDDAETDVRIEKASGIEVSKTFGIAKSDVRRHVIYGIVYAPDEVDTQGDTMSAAEIEKAAYGFMEARRTTHLDSDHDEERGKGFVAESWLIRKGDPLFPAEPEGAWAVGIQITDAITWDRIARGELTGLSLAGQALAEPVEPDVAKSSAPPAVPPEGAITPAASPGPTPEQIVAQAATAAVPRPEAATAAVPRPEAATKPAAAPGPSPEQVVAQAATLPASDRDVGAYLDEVIRRLEAVEKATPGRQTAPVLLDQHRTHRGLRIL